MFGEAYASICNNVIQNSRFAYINYVGKQMVGYPDCNVEKVMLTEFMKGISSGDPVSVEPKGGKSYEAILHAHPWINSNKAPHLLDEAHSLSRIFYVKIYPSTVNDRKRASFHDTIKEELPGFLFYAKQCWDKRALTDSQGRAEVISEIEETKEMVTSFIADDGDMYMLSTEVFEFHHEFNMDWSDFFDLAKEFYPNNRDNGNFKKYLVTKFSIKFDKTTRKVVGMRVK
jgi:phage/plasmid-associated DNA primase